MKSLRSRLVLSHTLPMLVLVPIVGVVLVYVLETQVVLANASTELTKQAYLIAELASVQDGLWEDTALAQRFVTHLTPVVMTQVMLLDGNGLLVASSNPDDAQHLGQILPVAGMEKIQVLEASVRTEYSRDLSAQVIDVLVPVTAAPDQHLLGAVRLTHQLAGLYERFLHLRYVILGVLVAALLIGAVVGWLLALGLANSLTSLTESVHELTTETQPELLPERGPEEMRRLLHAFNTLVERLRGAEEIRRRLLTNLVHELSRPLGAMLSAIQALLSGGDQDPAFRRELLEGMQSEVRRLQRLLSDLVQLRDRLSERFTLDRRPTALSTWLPQTLSPWREAAQQKGLVWQVFLAPDLPTLEVDPDRLGQALGNLLSNAVRYTPAGGTVSVSADSNGDAVRISVSDSGVGIAPEEQAHVFEPFYRVQEGRRFPQGMGLGLTIARDIVRAHGGRLEMESTPGQGSRFTIRLPLPSG
jgi:two-component system sensor histidine kinase BaeS